MGYQFTFGTRLCSNCYGAAVTFGEQRQGGIRYCYPCIIETPGWRGLTNQEALALTIMFRNHSEDPVYQALIRQATTLSDTVRRTKERS